MDSATNSSFMLLLTGLLIPTVGFMMAITPYLMKKSECFAVTVPESALHDPYLKGLKKRYLWLMLLFTLVWTLLCVALDFAGFELATIVMIVVGTLLIVVIGYGLMLYFRSKVRLYKKEQKWEASQQESVAFLGSGEVPQALSLKWSFAYLPLIALTLLVGYIGYAGMPDLVPVHAGLDGQIDGYAPKSPSLIWMPVLIQAFLVLSFVFSHWMILRAKRHSNPNAPATSAYAYGLFARAQSIFLVALGLIMTAAMITMPFAFMGLITLMQASFTLLIGGILAVVGGIAIAVVYGQGGSRVFARMQASNELLFDEDQYWKLGIFYYNPQDPSLFLLERFGVGWTVNFARPAVWAILIGFGVLTIAFIAAMVLFV
ncbi:MAG: DUF1648 domain-containing protein [Eggerthellaceae bacterium]|nr:DUF1648 domain-containing protein [Eggerthellaceae bacterium]